MTPYQKLLQDPRWQKKRLERFELSEWTCENCGATDKTLHVHHPLYKYGRKPWEYETEELQTLCDECHSAATQVDKLLKKYLASNAECYWSLVSIVAGYLHANFAFADQEDESALFEASCPSMRNIGVLASAMSILPAKDIRQVARMIFAAREASACPLSPIEQSLRDEMAEWRDA